MIRRPPRSSLSPYPPLFRSRQRCSACRSNGIPEPVMPILVPVNQSKKTKKKKPLFKHTLLFYYLYLSFFNDPAPAEIFSLSLPAALPISAALFGVPFEWDTGTSDADPGSGNPFE